MSDPSRRLGLVARLCVAGAVLLGVALVAIATRGGIGLTTDSRGYAMSANYLLAGEGLVTDGGRAGYVPLTHVAPLYPTLLAAGSRLSGRDVQSVARILNLIFFAFTAILTALLIRRLSGGWGFGAIFGALVLVISPDILRIHSMLWSEGAFIFFAIAALVCLGRYLDGDVSRKTLVLGSILAGLAFGVRYVGITLPVAVAILLLSDRKRLWQTRIRDTALLLIISCGPMALWMARNLYESGNLANRTIAFHPPGSTELDPAVATFSAWIIEATSSDLRKWFGLAAGLALLLYADVATRRRGLPRLLWTFAAIYLAFLLFSITFVDAYTPLDHRILAPLHIVFVVLVVSALLPSESIAKVRSVRNCATLALCAAFLIFQAQVAARWVRAAPDKWLGYANTSWNRSPLLKYVSKLPPQTLLYSNGVDVLYLLADRHAKAIPTVVDPSTRGEPGPTADDPISLIRQDLSASGGQVIYFRTIRRSYKMSETELQRVLGLKLIFEASDGAAYQLDTK